MTPSKHQADAHNCASVREIISRIGDKWSIYIVKLLSDGPVRFNELKRSIDGISQRMLTLTLRGLERDGLVSRTVTPTIPPRVDYALTAMGGTLIETMQALAGWAVENSGAIAIAREKFDRKAVKVSGSAASPPRATTAPAQPRAPARTPRRAAG